MRWPLSTATGSEAGLLIEVITDQRYTKVAANCFPFSRQGTAHWSLPASLHVSSFSHIHYNPALQLRLNQRLGITQQAPRPCTTPLPHTTSQLIFPQASITQASGSGKPAQTESAQHGAVRLERCVHAYVRLRGYGKHCSPAACCFVPRSPALPAACHSPRIAMRSRPSSPLL